MKAKKKKQMVFKRVGKEWRPCNKGKDKTLVSMEFVRDAVQAMALLDLIREILDGQSKKRSNKRI